MTKKIGLSLIASTFLFAASYEYSIGMGKYFNKVQNYNVVNLKLSQYLKQNRLTLSLEQSLPIKIDDKTYYLTKLETSYNYFLNSKNNIYPYLIGGVGGAFSTNKDDLKSTGFITLGIGFIYSQNQNSPSNLFLEIRAQEDFVNKMLHYGAIFGINYKFNAKYQFISTAQPQQQSYPKPKNNYSNYTTTYQPVKTTYNYDTDQDGVPNSLDECPNTPLNVTVNEYGCPIDSDRDGVADYLDKCPFTPFGVKVNQYGCAIDTDKDGVVDTLDKCPNTPRGVKVDKDGCPKFSKIKPTPSTPAITPPMKKISANINLPKDSDEDGVIDKFDKCPNTPLGVVVGTNGCPINIDSDKDGVPDMQDKCPNTLPGAKVDKNGCIYEFDFKIKFRKNSTKIDPIYYPRIKMFADFLKTHPKYSAEIQGYTDNKGPARYNKILSEKRAKAVYKLLIKFGVNPERLSYFGYGEENPLYPNGKYGNPKNRRVVAKLYKL